MSDTSTNNGARNEDGLIVPRNWTQFIFAIFVRLVEIISALLGIDETEATE